jgi:hypothetical protein
MSQQIQNLKNNRLTSIETQISELSQKRTQAHTQLSSNLDNYKKERESIYKKLSEAISGLSSSEK